MNFLLSTLTLAGMALVIGIGIVLAAKGSPWLLVLSFLGFVWLFAKYGCLSDHG